MFLGPPEWRSGLRCCVTTDHGLITGCIAAGRDRETREATHIWPSVVRLRGGFGRQGCPCPHLALVTSVAGQAQCTLTWSPGVQCFLRHICAAGIRVKRALCQEAVRLGRVVFRRTHGSPPLPLLSLYGSCSDGTRL
jgi:hypothetical protein